MNIRLYNAKILTMEKDRPVFDGEIWIKNEKIVYVGETRQLEKFWKDDRDICIIWDQEIDCEGNLLMPGFKDAHAHSAMTLFRTSAENLPLDRWLKEQIFPMEAKLLPEDIAVLSKLAIMEYVSGGITAVFDMYLTPDSIAEAFIESGMLCGQCGTVNNFTHSAKELEELAAAGEHTAKVRAWLQDFTATWLDGYTEYGVEEIRAQIDAVYDAGYSEWFMWNAASNYTKEAYLTEDVA